MKSFHLEPGPDLPVREQAKQALKAIGWGFVLLLLFLLPYIARGSINSVYQHRREAKQKKEHLAQRIQSHQWLKPLEPVRPLSSVLEFDVAVIGQEPNPAAERIRERSRHQEHLRYEWALRDYAKRLAAWKVEEEQLKAELKALGG